MEGSEEACADAFPDAFRTPSSGRGLRSSRGQAKEDGHSSAAGMVEEPISLPVEMKSWVDARSGGPRYVDASDYIRDLIRRDQERKVSTVGIEAALGGGRVDAGAGPGDEAGLARRRRTME